MNKLNKSIDLSKIYNNKFVQIIVNILFSLSTASLTAILIVSEWSSSVIDIILPTLSFSIMLFIVFKFKLLSKIFNNTNKIILFISAILGAYAIYITSTNMLKYSTTFANVIFVVLAIPASITFLYWFYTKALYYFKLFFKSLDKLEKNFLIISTCILTVVILIFYNVTNIFSHAHISEENRQYTIQYTPKTDETNAVAEYFVNRTFHRIHGDIIFTTDTQALIGDDAYNNICYFENDIRQPLFSIVSIPFTILPRLISDITFEEIYPTLLAIVHGVILFTTIILLEKLMKLKGCTRLIFMILLTITYPTLLFAINLEQYVIPVFYLITFIYMSINNIKDKDILYIISTGSMLTSGIFFPLLGEKGNLKQSIKNIFITFLKTVVIFIISAKILFFLPSNLEKQVDSISRFTGSKVSFTDRINMYTNFTSATTIAPEIEIVNEDFANQTLSLNGNIYRIDAQNYRVVQANTKDFNAFGLVVFMLATLGFALNRKNTFSKICFAWILFSVALLPILGYGAYEDGFILYTYYFSWAFVCLIFKLVEKLLSKWPKIKNTFYTLTIIPMTIINFYGIYQLIEFGMQYYK